MTTKASTAKTAASAKRAAPAKTAARKSAAKKVSAKTAAKPSVAPEKKQKLVRDSFTMPNDDFKLIDQLKDRALGFKRPTKKSELLRAGLQALSKLNATQLQAALNALAPLKPGRPKKTAE